MPPDLDAAADDLRRINLEANATPSERIRLLAEQDPSAFLVRFDLGMGGDMLVSENAAESVTLDDELGADPSASTLAIVQRIRLRVELSLPPRDCNSRRQREGCRCLQKALDQLLAAEGVTRDEVVRLARDVHKQQRADDRAQKRIQKAQRKEADMRAKAAGEASESSPPSATPQTATVRARVHPRRRRSHEPPDPLSWSEFKRAGAALRSAT